MAMKMNRRTFLKTSAAAAAAISLTGLLGGCGDSAIGTDFGGFQATVTKLRSVDNTEAGEPAKEWKADVKVWVRVKDTTGAGTPVNAEQSFALYIDDQYINMVGGDLLNNNKQIYWKKNEAKENWMHFELAEGQQAMYEGIVKRTAKITFTIKTLKKEENYTLDYNDPSGYTFVKD